MSLRLTVTGLRGQVVTALIERAKAHGIEVESYGRPELDLADEHSVAMALRRARGDVFVNAAAYTAVDKAESERTLCDRINGQGAGAVAAAAALRGKPVIHLSTDYVFDGTCARPYREDDPPHPLGVYGNSKLQGEREVVKANPQHVIVRTAWVYSPFGHNFVKTMLRLGGTRSNVAVVADQVGSPTSALDIADGVLQIARRLHEGRVDESRWGIFNMASAGTASWADFAEAIFARACENGAAAVDVKRITTLEYPTAARRPSNSRLDTGKIATIYGIELPHWRTSLAGCVDRLMRAT